MRVSKIAKMLIGVESIVVQGVAYDEERDCVVISARLPRAQAVTLSGLGWDQVLRGVRGRQGGLSRMRGDYAPNSLGRRTTVASPMPSRTPAVGTR